MSDSILKIAVTGSAGSGKSLVCQHFKAIGLVVLDCDVIARSVVEPGTNGFIKMIELFGQKIVDKKGLLDRAKLRKILINDSKMRQKMEAVLHPLINQEMVFQMENAEYRNVHAVAVEVPLLFELGIEHYFDTTIAVVADEMELVQRICDRDSVQKDDALKMLDLQLSQNEKQRRADHVLVNKGVKSELFKSVEKLFQHMQTVQKDNPKKSS